MNATFLLIVCGVAAAYFGAHVLRIIPTFLRLLVASRAGAVKWPGPRIHDSDLQASKLRGILGVAYENLFSTFTRNSLTVSAALFYSGWGRVYVCSSRLASLPEVS
jgi:hypothetical protein